MARNRDTVLSIIGFSPHRITSGVTFTRELSQQLAARGWNSVLCFLDPPNESVRGFLAGPNVTFDVAQDTARLSWTAIRGVFDAIRRHRPRILHLHFTSFLNPYSWMAKLLGVEQVYFTDHTSQPEGFVPTRAPLWKRLAMRTIHCHLTGVISVSQYGYRNFTVRDLIPTNRFHLVYNSIDLDYAATGAGRGEVFRRRYGIPQDRLVISQVSWLIPDKGFDDLLTAAREVAAAEPRAHFVLVGEGSHRGALEKLACDLGIAPRVTFTGKVEDLMADGLYDASDVVCQMSRWEEVFGSVNAEAMALGKPVVGTRVGGIPEIIQDGVTGFLVERRDTAAMAARMIELLRDPDLRQRMGAAGQRVCREKFNMRTNVAQLMGVYGI